tara:strand:- start:107 stop:325 length:219 start_codon:yes stop_codon:yes gene_type:complete
MSKYWKIETDEELWAEKERQMRLNYLSEEMGRVIQVLIDHGLGPDDGAYPHEAVDSVLKELSMYRKRENGNR